MLIISLLISLLFLIAYLFELKAHLKLLKKHRELLQDSIEHINKIIACHERNEIMCAKNVLFADILHYMNSNITPSKEYIDKLGSFIVEHDKLSAKLISCYEDCKTETNEGQQFIDSLRDLEVPIDKG